jgi:hypothetical protein
MNYMKNFNKKLTYSAAFVLLILLPACSDFLEQPEGSTLTQEMVFSDPDMAMKSLFTVYGSCVVNGFITGEGGSNQSDAGTRDGLMMATCDEGDQYGGNQAASFKNGTWGPTNQNEFDILKAMAGIRAACVFLDNVDSVPLRTTAKYNFTETYCAQVKGEAKVLRAMIYFELLRRFGGMPIMSSTPKVVVKEVDGLKKAFIVPEAYRQSFKSTVDFIVSSCDDAAQYLPNAYGSAEQGRVTKGFALGLKARTLLYAASPLYNAAAPPVSYGDQKDSLICYGNYNQNRWKMAADAAKTAIDWAEANGYALTTDNQVGNRVGEGYQIGTGAALDSRNKEIIYFDHSHGQQPGGANIIRWGCPIYYSWGNCVMAMPVNYLQTFRDKNGNDIASLPATGNFTSLKGYLRNIEPRFHESIWVPGKPYTQTGYMNANGGQDTAKFLYRKGGLTGNVVQTGAGTQLMGIGVPNGFYLKKFINQVNSGNGTCNLFWPTMRLAELYLNYAEALNECDPTNPDIILYLNKIRFRGGIPNLVMGNAAYNTPEKMRELIRRERSVELYAEEHRPFDVRRWKIASNDGVMKGKFYKIYFYENGTGTYKASGETGFPTTSAGRMANDNFISYKIEEYETRIWEDKMYFYPIPQSEVNKGFLRQNPGW